MIGAERGDANSGIRRHLPGGNLAFDNPKILKWKKNDAETIGLARRNLENHERDKTVKIMHGFSFEFEEAKMMVAILVPEVKSANGVNTF